ncbi:type II toxin-antitoxin system antitoxin, TscA family [Mammaliicoccus fleurettii]|uniref:TscA family type II toxin-antitoxin system antitoxin n=1 Tax=Mammaliicoccus fleurettii TaxID=150056 RepID=UPI001AACEEF4|nr:hypothetical protein [Mammaliicoccus fleurettii]MBO3062768.1 hypothetical protein [Mammaliicoccus fleurettii]MEB7723432.1 hypothetical protein [Mammaliicoccus fleurettii]
MNGEETVILTEVVEILEAVVEDKRETYTLITEFNGEKSFYKVDREKQLESVIEWAIDQIGQNFELE